MLPAFYTLLDRRNPSAVLPETLCVQPRKTFPPARHLIGTEDELNQYRIAESKGGSKYPVNLEGSVVSINRDAKALTVSLGTNAGIAPNSRLAVVRNGEKLAELRVVSVETTTCVAEFASLFPDNLSKVVVGDSVISTIK